MLIKIEGSYHGHHDSIMFSVGPDRSQIGPREHPVTVPQALGIPLAFADLVRVVPFNDLVEVRRAFEENPSRIAGMIVEPAMMNCGVIFPEPGYLQGIKDLLHEAGAYLAFDEVKTGLTLAYGGAAQIFGVTPDILCLAKALGGGLPCGAIGGTAEAMSMIIEGSLEQVGTFNGNPLTMAAARVNLTEVLTKDAYGELDRIRAAFQGCEDVIAEYHLPASMKLLGAKGSIDWHTEPIHEYRDLWDIDDRIPQLAWLWQLNRGVFKSPGSKWESWTSSIVHTNDDVQRYVDNFAEMAAAITS
jgi:glutamate-1-semialdehyde 2,1-aminomutase